MRQFGRKKRSPLPKIILILLLATLAFFSWKFFKENQKLKSKLSSLTIVNLTDNLTISDGMDFSGNDYLFTEKYLTKGTTLKSPFNDNNTLKYLVENKINSKWQDLYGCRRRTGNIKRIHEGIDIFVPENTNLYPISNFGIVTEVSNDPDFELLVDGTTKDGKAEKVAVEYGKIVRIAYPEGFQTIYAHMNEVSVKKGDFVYANTLVGKTGVTGNLKESGKASHLHIEMRDSNDKSFDPKKRIYYQSNFKNLLTKIKNNETNGDKNGN